MREFEGMSVVVTGAGAGIGSAAALMFARRGAKLVVNSMTAANCAAVAERIKALGGSAVAVPGDASDEDTVRRLFEAAPVPDVLVNCAGVVPQGDLFTTDMSDWDAAFGTNVKSVFLCSREAVARMLGRGGAIVNVASVAGVKGVKNRALYSATKGAVIALTKSLAAEHVGDGIRINAVSPGTVISPSLRARIDQADDPQAEMAMFVSRQPMGRLGEPDEIAEAILFLANPGNGFMTGQNLVCDGGISM